LVGLGRWVLALGLPVAVLLAASARGDDALTLRDAGLSLLVTVGAAVCSAAWPAPGAPNAPDAPDGPTRPNKTGET
jgi:hypothetical protein